MGLYNKLYCYFYFQVTLPSGRLNNVTLYIHETVDEIMPFRFQIWKPMGGTEYRLVYESIINLPTEQGEYDVSTQHFTMHHL